MAAGHTTTAARVEHGFRVCLSRDPDETELHQLVGLFDEARERLAKYPEKAERLATDPIGPMPEGEDAVELAAWTVVGNVLLNLDEMFLKR